MPLRCLPPLLPLLLSIAPALAAPPATRPAKELNPATLAALYHQTLGPAYRDADFPKLLQAHRLLEAYFAAPTPAAREPLLAQLLSLNLPLSTLPQLCSLHLDWPTLTPGVYYINEPYGTGRVRYFLGLPPGYDLTKPWPLAILLPQADAFLTTPLPDGDTVARIYTGWMKEELSRHTSAIVLMPLLNLDEFWGPSQLGLDSVLHPLLHATSLVRTDPARVYLLGHGFSGHAAWNIGLHYPTYFAALDVLAGSATQDNQRLRVANLRNTLPVVWHDTDDQIIPVRHARGIVQQLRRLKYDVAYNETKDLGHVPPQPVAEQNYTQTLARTRTLYPKRITIASNRPEAEFNRVDWAEITDPSHPGDDQRLLFRHGTGDMTVYKNAFKLDATLDAPNHFTVTTENVASFRLYLNDQMADLSKPITVTVNNRPRFQGLAAPSLKTMLDDQLFLGRGWRTFTAAIDVEVVPPPPTTRPRR